MTDKLFKDFDKCQNIEYTKSYRFDENLNNILLGIRNKMKEYKGDTNKLFKYVKETIPDRFFKKRI